VGGARAVSPRGPVPVKKREKGRLRTHRRPHCHSQFLLDFLLLHSNSILIHDHVITVSHSTGNEEKNTVLLTIKIMPKTGRLGFKPHYWKGKKPNKKCQDRIATTLLSDQNVSGEKKSNRTSTMIETPPQLNMENDSCHYCCYLLRSLDPQYHYKTYIGYSPDPERRLRQHNGELSSGSARTTKVSGRPWALVLIVDGFIDSRTALQFEWAWQHANKSLTFRKAVDGSATVAAQLHRRRGVIAKMVILRILLSKSDAFSRLPLIVYFYDERCMDDYSALHQGSTKHSEEGTHLAPTPKHPYAFRPNPLACHHKIKDSSLIYESKGSQVVFVDEMDTSAIISFATPQPNLGTQYNPINLEGDY